MSSLRTGDRDNELKSLSHCSVSDTTLENLEPRVWGVSVDVLLIDTGVIRAGGSVRGGAEDVTGVLQDPSGLAVDPDETLLLSCLGVLEFKDSSCARVRVDLDRTSVSVGIDNAKDGEKLRSGASAINLEGEFTVEELFPPPT